MPDELSLASSARAVLAARERGAGSVTALALSGLDAGRRMVFIGPSGDEPSSHVECLGAFRRPGLEEAAVELARAYLTGADSPGRHGRDAGTVEMALPGTEPGVPIYFERVRPVPGLLIVGAGHLAGPLHEVADLLGFRVTVVDDRPEFARPARFPRAAHVLEASWRNPFEGVLPQHRTHVLLVTRGHKYDYECLRLLLRDPRPPGYIGMIGSRRRVRATFHQLREEGIPEPLLRRIRAPVGLDLGAETPAEIAVAVAAEWVQLRRGGTGRPLVEVERIAERFFSEEES